MSGHGATRLPQVVLFPNVSLYLVNVQPHKTKKKHIKMIGERRWACVGLWEVQGPGVCVTALVLIVQRKGRKGMTITAKVKADKATTRTADSLKGEDHPTAQRGRTADNRLLYTHFIFFWRPYL